MKGENEMTFDDFYRKYIGKPIDFDSVAGVQCVDLIDQYLKDVFGITGVYVNGARDFWNKFTSFPKLVKNFIRVPNTIDLVVKKGDIVVWGGGKWGHIAIGTGEGNAAWFKTIEQNTLGRHEKTQVVKHYFNNKSGNDSCSPVLGVLRPKGKDLPILDKNGLKFLSADTFSVYALKSMLSLAENKGVIMTHITVDDGLGEGTVKVINYLLDKWGYQQNGIAGKNFIKNLTKVLKEK